MNSERKMILMTADDYAEWTVLRRRMEYLELRSNLPLWAERKYWIEAAYADVRDRLPTIRRL